ncbi:LicD family protein [Exiguobacterium sp. s5]|uniref:LicD family protein n=1 Tax=Exiguobacterium sp. s5 TaxID=2751239 RepID=UPI001BE60174|nr:LicD family protein [Exiguobacterium sp. s5]
MNDLLEKVHKVQLEMALEVKRICEKHDIQYSIIAGTLLGAVRHKGFIPWDDDLDIGMMRDEYERFLQICNLELNPSYFLQTWETDPHFALPIAKIRKKGTKFVEKNSANSNLHSGIYIDIFPFDNVPNNNIKKKLQTILAYVLKRILLIKMNYKVYQDGDFLKKYFYALLKFASYAIDVRLIKKYLNETMKLSNKNNSSKIVTFGGAYGYQKESIERDWLENLRDIDFENEKFLAPIRCEQYLTYFYGDYLTPPPERQRLNRHNIVEVSFEEEF